MFNYNHYCISGCHVKWYCYCSVSILGAFTSCARTLVLQKDFIDGKALILLDILCIILFYFPLSLLSTIASRMIMLFLFYRFATSSTRTLHSVLRSSYLRHMRHFLANRHIMIGICHFTMSSSHHFLWLLWGCLTKTFQHGFVWRYVHHLASSKLCSIMQNNPCWTNFYIQI